ncbi:TetR family transcriptional regulator [Roseibium hamelinense]|uniref:TetR family transcriptional regulator n=2 Tax=Roseibium hamelinense TaxID=150831 RepID=A0A562T977_9HYPH|nr:TetR/AcrR family transcriptional regulator [Roseibium hamelinense]TWI90082.1 TetR family transcriptional regulator [Roseibium hamelinense]
MTQADDIKPSGWRGSRELWLQAAYDQLLEHGIDAVKVMPLANRLSLSRTSFYGHFSDREDLLQDLIDMWQAKNTQSLVRQSKAYAGSAAEAILNVFDCWLNSELFDSRLEFAIRNWAHTDAPLGETLKAADGVRVAAFTAMFERHGFSNYDAEIRANAMYQTQIGYISMKAEEPLSDRIARMPAYAQTFAGEPPSDAETARFLARHAARLTK